MKKRLFSRALWALGVWGIGVPLVVGERVIERLRRFLPANLSRKEAARWTEWHVADRDPEDEAYRATLRELLHPKIGVRPPR